MRLTLQQFQWVLLISSLIFARLSAKPNNFVLITIDTIRADRLGCYGYEKARTPVIDGLAREGVLFEKAFSTVPLTLPAHASIMTGTYPLFHGIRDNSGFVLPDKLTTLAEVLRSEGYTTGGFVGAFVLDSKFGLDQGFDHYLDDFDLSKFESVSPGYIQRTGDKVIDATIEWLEGNRREPFFAWVHLYDPHDPYTPPEPFLSRHPNRPYDGEIEFTDSNLGTLFDWMREKEVYEDTLIILVGDHGESLGDHGEAKHGFFVYNAALHVPLIVRLPGGESGGQRVHNNVSILDIPPTVVQLLSLSRGAIPEAQGVGLGFRIIGKRRLGSRELYAETYYPFLQFGWSPLRTVISDSHKYIQAPQRETYDLAADFTEQRNLAPSESALTNRLRQSLEHLEQRYADASGAADALKEMDSATLEKLRTLGYVSLSMGSKSTADFDDLADPKEQITLYSEITHLFSLSLEGKHREVIPAYKRILAGYPDLKIVRYKLGQAYFQTRQYPLALEQFKKVIELAGEDALATFDLAQTYMRMGRQEEAIVGFERTLTIDPDHYRARTNLGVLYKNQGRFSEAVEELETALRVSPDSVFALSNLGVTYSMLNRHDEAEEVLMKALLLSPENASICANLGVAYQRMGRVQEAKEYLERARELDPGLFQKPGTR